MAHGIKTGGRTRGTPNKITRAFREAVQTVYAKIGGDEAFADWAKANPSQFYAIAARLIPQELRHSGSDGQRLSLQIVSYAENVIEGEATRVLPQP